MSNISKIRKRHLKLADALAEAFNNGMSDEEFAELRQHTKDHVDYVNYISRLRANGYESDTPEVKKTPEPEIEEEGMTLAKLYQDAEASLRKQTEHINVFNDDDSDEFIASIRRIEQMTGIPVTKETVDSAREIQKMVASLNHLRRS